LQILRGNQEAEFGAAGPGNRIANLAGSGDDVVDGEPAGWFEQAEKISR
jgi:hypothetical protein